MSHDSRSNRRLCHHRRSAAAAAGGEELLTFAFPNSCRGQDRNAPDTLGTCYTQGIRSHPLVLTLGSRDYARFSSEGYK